MDININKLRAALTHAGNGDRRAYCNSVLIESGANGAYAVATDGYAMFVGHLGDADPTLRALTVLPRSVVELAIKSVKRDGMITLTPDGIGQIAYTSPVPAPAYPIWRRVVPHMPAGLCAGMFAPDLLARARSALMRWDGTRNSAVQYPIMGDPEEGSGMMIGESAIVIIMPYRTGELPTAYPFAI